MPATLSRRQLNRATLARQLLLAREPLSAVEAVERLAGMQAQEPKHPFIGLWTRVEGFHAEELLATLHAREVVRATLMRSTLHLMSAADYAAVRMALQPPRSVALRVLGARSQGLDLDKVLPAARKLLAGSPLPFDEIRARLHEQFPDVNDRALGYAVRTLVPLVMVPSEDGRWGFPRVSSFALAEECLDEPLAAQHAAAEALVTRYLGAFGPASAKDAERWSAVGGHEGGARRHARSPRGVRRRARARALRPAGRRRDPARTSRRRRAFCRSSTTSCSPTTTARA